MKLKLNLPNPTSVRSWYLRVGILYTVMIVIHMNVFYEVRGLELTGTLKVAWTIFMIYYGWGFILGWQVIKEDFGKLTVWKFILALIYFPIKFYISPILGMVYGPFWFYKRKLSSTS